MAGGEGGFSTKAMGFDKKEVNDYIANLNQRMKEIEAEKKTNDEKTQKALKAAQDADAKIKAVKDENAKKIADLELQLKTERRNEENLLIQIDDLKRKLKQGGGAAAGNKNAEAAIANANATAKSIIDKANATAKETVEKAKAAANQMIAQAQASGGSGGVDPEKLDAFMKVLNNFAAQMTGGLNDVNKKASELLGAKAAAPVAVPDFSNITAPQADAPKAAAPAPAKAAKTTKPDVDDDMFSMLDDEEPATDDNIFDDMVTEVQPLDDPSTAPGAVVLDEFDLPTGSMDLDIDTPVTEVKPINNKKQGKADLSDDFEKQMLAQTANSSALREELDDVMLAAVKQQEEHFAVKPTDNGMDDFSMDSPEDEDPLAAMLKQAELTFGGGGDDISFDSDSSEPEESSAASDNSANPWAALQDELFAMEKSGDLGGSEIEGGDSSSSASGPAVPNADDSAIWDFGDDSSSSSDDDDMGMSSDLFGSF